MSAKYLPITYFIQNSNCVNEHQEHWVRIKRPFLLKLLLPDFPAKHYKCLRCKRKRLVFCYN
jgi:hypothetical protein